MPGFVKTKKDEKKWEKAKDIAGEDKSGEAKWALANYLFHHMNKTKESDKKKSSKK